MKRTCDKTSDFITHFVDLPACCPISKNPAPGSFVTVEYQAKLGLVIDVNLLSAEILNYVSGHESGVRDMERMIQRIADWCFSEIQAPMLITACLHLNTVPTLKHEMIVRCYRS